MDAPRPFSTLHTLDQWARASHDGTALDVDAGGGVTLAWLAAQGDPGPPGDAVGARGGLGFDHECRGYHSRTAAGQVDRALSPWTRWTALFNPDAAAQPGGDFAPVAGGDVPLSEPGALCVDIDDRLYIAERDAGRVVVLDLWSGRLLRRATLSAPVLDLAAHGRRVWALLGGAIVALGARTTGAPRPLASLDAVCAPGARSARLAADPAKGALRLLVTGAGTDAWVVALRVDAAGGLSYTGTPIAVPGAGDLEWDGDGLLVVARGPGADFRTFASTDAGDVEDLPLGARGYDGDGIARAPDGRIAYWSDAGLRHATLARPRYRRSGAVTTYRLDAGALQTEWGRVFIDACVPDATAISVRATATDDDDPDARIARQPPANAAALTIVAPEASPPMPALWLDPASPEIPDGLLHRRESGRELPWAPASPEDRFATYEAPIDAPRGRFLWVRVALAGDGHRTPRVRSLRAEHPGHELITRLPRTFSRDSAQASFLRRYLAIADGLLSDLDARAALRAALLKPAGAPTQALPWLAGFVGLVLDDRWPEAARRELIARAAWLFRYRGTIMGLGTFLEIVLGRPVVIVERWRLRGLGGGLGGGDAPDSSSVLGGGFRIGGAVGEPGSAPLTGDEGDAIAASAHRFSVIVPLLLSSEQHAMVQHVLDVHRPAHTVVELCTAGSGIRVGRGLHIGLLSTIGRTGAFDTLQLGATTIGRTAVVGRPEPGVTPAASRLGQDTRVG